MSTTALETLPPIARTILITFALMIEHDLRHGLNFSEVAQLTGWSVRTLRSHLADLVKANLLRVDTTTIEHRYFLNVEIEFDHSAMAFTMRPVKLRTRWLAET